MSRFSLQRPSAPSRSALASARQDRLRPACHPNSSLILSHKFSTRFAATVTHAIYLNVTTARNDGTTIRKLEVKDVAVDGLWSISLYGSDGFFHTNALNARIGLNDLTAKKAADGSVTIQFGAATVRFRTACRS